MTAVCIGCRRRADEIPEYIAEARMYGASPDTFVRLNEGTYNKQNGHFLCTDCYLKAGSPVGENGGWWIAP